jgi:hypothetical protein
MARVYWEPNQFARTTLRAFNCRFGVALLLVALAESVQAQQVQGSIAVTGGSATDVRGITSRAMTVTPGVVFTPYPRLAFALTANGTRFDNSQWAAGGGAALSGRAPLGRHAAFTVAGNANVTRTSYDFSYMLGDVVPAIEVSAGAVTGFVGVHGSAAATSAVTETHGTTPGILGGTPFVSRSTSSVSRSARGAVFGGTVRIPGSNGESMIAGVREEHSRVDSLSLVDRSATLTAANGRVSIGGSIGVRSEPGSRSTFGNGVLTVAVSPAIAIELIAGSYPTNHLVGTPAGRYLNLGLSLRTPRLMSNAPAPEGAPAPLAGLTRFEIRDGDAQRVALAGDFTNWRTIAARRAPNGVWFLDLKVPPGEYRYAFRIDGHAWKVPEGAAVVDDDFGGKSAVLIVSAPK